MAEGRAWAGWESSGNSSGCRVPGHGHICPPESRLPEGPGPPHKHSPLLSASPCSSSSLWAPGPARCRTGFLSRPCGHTHVPERPAAATVWWARSPRVSVTLTALGGCGAGGDGRDSERTRWGGGYESRELRVSPGPGAASARLCVPCPLPLWLRREGARLTLSPRSAWAPPGPLQKLRVRPGSGLLPHSHRVSCLWLRGAPLLPGPAGGLHLPLGLCPARTGAWCSHSTPLAGPTQDNPHSRGDGRGAGSAWSLRTPGSALLGTGREGGEARAAPSGATCAKAEGRAGTEHLMPTWAAPTAPRQRRGAQEGRTEATSQPCGQTSLPRPPASPAPSLQPMAHGPRTRAALSPQDALQDEPVLGRDSSCPLPQTLTELRP